MRNRGPCREGREQQISDAERRPALVTRHAFRIRLPLAELQIFPLTCSRKSWPPASKRLAPRRHGSKTYASFGARLPFEPKTQQGKSYRCRHRQNDGGRPH